MKMEMTFGFSIYGLVVFLLPMVVNICYAIWPPLVEIEGRPCPIKGMKQVEQITRILFAIVLCILVSKEKPSIHSLWFYAAVIFFALYHVAWGRYFIGGRNTALMGQALWFVPIPLAVFPVLYFFCAALWLGNLPAAVIMVIFGVAHYIVSYYAFCCV